MGSGLKTSLAGQFFIVAWQVSKLSQMFLHHLHSDSISAVSSVTKIRRFINFFVEAEFLEYKATKAVGVSVAGMREQTPLQDQ